MPIKIDPAVLRIYKIWHDTVESRDLEGTAALYAERAVLETPLALAVYPERGTGIVEGRTAILEFFEESARKFSGDLAKWYRNDTFFVNGQRLCWEYPRQTPTGDQVDLMEMMEIEAGLIASHRVYWGWYGVKLLAPAISIKV